MLGFSYCCLLWYLSVKLVYGVPSQYYAYIIWLLVLILDTVVQLNTGKSENAELGHSRTSIFKDYLRESSYKHIFSIGFLLSNLTYVETAMPYLEAVQLIILFLEVRTKLAVIKPFLDLRKEIVLIESFLLLLVIAHIFVKIALSLGPHSLSVVEGRPRRQLGARSQNPKSCLDDSIHLQSLLGNHNYRHGGLRRHYASE